MNAGFPQPGQGLFFNKRLLIESGIDPETLYDMQANGTWTRDACLDIISKVQQAIGSGDILENFVMKNNQRLNGHYVERALKMGKMPFWWMKYSGLLRGMRL